MPLLRYKCVNRIPYARGMGSSSAAIVAGLIGGLVLSGHQLPMWGHEKLLQLACEIEVRSRFKPTAACHCYLFMVLLLLVAVVVVM